ncbi:hypothetical protein M2347_003849 [Chryseobacterium sp. H1D6B]|uniref:GIY-YIG nuclease family protein n=1 Tax=Chryseobacterium sp. H1D6B TaxID=2940588 RepID=UPI0015CBE802|nr:GIY-YIG nuclease family protein [Chryseobacterium sp. H1D6B]MDH6254122.1 hypothetical protein [Chryseobacterium sp. H1D6B]
MKNSIKQQLREKAKSHTITMGVLAVKNTTSGKLFIQGSVNLEALANKIKFSLKSGQFSNIQLQNDWNNWKEESFIFEFITVIELQENSYINYRQEVSKAEKTAIEEYGARTELY